MPKAARNPGVEITWRELYALEHIVVSWLRAVDNKDIRGNRWDHEAGQRILTKLNNIRIASERASDQDAEDGSIDIDVDNPRRRKR